MKKNFCIGQVEKKVGENGEDIFSIIASTSAVDRQGDVVDQKGWDLVNFMKNPVLVWAHDYSQLPIGKVVSAQVVKGKLIADFIFASAEMNPFAQQVKSLYMEGFLNASSVGFIPLERQGNTITKAELLELSLVPVPANQEALRLAMSKGLNVDFVEAALKGAVAAEVSAEENMDMKYENWSEMSEILSALWTVYFNKDTPVDQWSTLLTEAITLLQAIADGTEVEGTEEKGIVAKAISPESLKAFEDHLSTKAGATLSKNSLEIIGKAMEAMGTSCTHLQSLVDSCKPKEAGIEDVAEVEIKETEVPVDAVKTGGAEGEETVTLTAKEILEHAQSMLRTNAKANEGVLLIVNSFLSKKSQQVA